MSDTKTYKWILSTDDTCPKLIDATTKNAWLYMKKTMIEDIREFGDFEETDFIDANGKTVDDKDFDIEHFNLIYSDFEDKAIIIDNYKPNVDIFYGTTQFSDWHLENILIRLDRLEKEKIVA